MDTQGTFDPKTTSAVNSFIFGFSLAMSSAMMYVMDRTRKSDSLHEAIGTFQSLKFLVCDWSDETRYAYGSDGGQKC